MSNYVETRYSRRNARAAGKTRNEGEVEFEFNRVRRAILEALKPYDEARRAVAEALVLLRC